MKHIISVIVENKFGVLARIAGLFSARGYNISSLAVSETNDPEVSCMTIVVEAEDEKILEQIKKQLNRLIDVLTVTDFTKKDHVERELILIKLDCPAKSKLKLENALDKCGAKLIRRPSASSAPRGEPRPRREADSATVEFTGEQAQIKGLLEELGQFKIKELVRTGKIAIS